MSGAFPAALKPDLQDIRKEFHLTAAGKHTWRLAPAHVVREKCRPPEPSTRESESGTLSSTPIRFDNPHGPQPLRWVLHSTGKSDITEVALEIDGRQALAAPVTLAPGMILRYDGGDAATLFDASWHQQASTPVQAAASLVATGPAPVRVGYRSRGADPELTIELRTLGPSVRLSARPRRPAAAH